MTIGDLPFAIRLTLPRNVKLNYKPRARAYTSILMMSNGLTGTNAAMRTEPFVQVV